MQLAVVDALNQMIEGKEGFLKQLEHNISQVMNQTYDQTVEQVDDLLHDLQKQLNQAANQKEDYERIAEQIYELREKKQELMIQNAINEEKRRRLSDIKAFLKTQHTRLEEYGEGLTNRLVEGVVIKDECIEVELKTRDIINIDK
ncbi:hypothetical protein HMPREF2811_09370 [Globicatella sp. HMSC072A10]|nr:hypothetical protein HMPREF2811_09370 [Globicatella sp. HMSC072A10]